MSTIANPFPVTRSIENEPPNNIINPGLQNKVRPVTLKDEMPPTRRHGATDNDFELREIVHNLALASTQTSEAVKALTAQVQSQPQANNSRSIDTLRRDIGILAILLGMMVQTGAAFYWAGGVSRSQEAAKEISRQQQEEAAYMRAQLQLIDGKLQKIEGREAERERNQKGR